MVILKIIAAKECGLEVYKVVNNVGVIYGTFMSYAMARTRVMEILNKSGV